MRTDNDEQDSYFGQAISLDYLVLHDAVNAAFAERFWCYQSGDAANWRVLVSRGSATHRLGAYLRAVSNRFRCCRANGLLFYILHVIQTVKCTDYALSFSNAGL